MSGQLSIYRQRRYYWVCFGSPVNVSVAIDKDNPNPDQVGDFFESTRLRYEP